MSKKIRKDLRFESTGSCELLAAADDKSLPTLKISAYTGKMMRPRGYFYPVVVDLQGARYDKQVTPVLMDHDTDKRLGFTAQQSVIPAGPGQGIFAIGTLTSDSDYAKSFQSDAKKGFPFQTSIGAEIKSGAFIPEGKTAHINGKDWNGPFIHAKRSVIRELTVTVLGADNDTSTTLAATAGPDLYLEINDMTFEAFVEDLGLKLDELSETTVNKLRAQWESTQEPDDEPAPKKGKAKSKPKVKKTVKATAGGDDDDDDDDAADDDGMEKRRVQAADEFDRMDSIQSMFQKYPDVESVLFRMEGSKSPETSVKDFKKHAIKSGMNADQVELHLLRASYPKSDVQTGIHVVNKDLNAKALECSILRYYGIPDEAVNKVTGRGYGLSAMGYDEKTLDASHNKEHRYHGTYSELQERQIEATGKYVPASLRHSPSDLQASAWHAWNAVTNNSRFQASGFSTLNIVNLLENVGNKSALAAFESAEVLWRFFVGRKPANDFKAQSLYRLDFSGHFRKVATDGELKHISLQDTKKTVTVDTYGAMITIDRKTQRNDDLGLIVDKCRSLGTLGALRIEESVFVTLLANSGSFFHANNGNLLSGGTSPLSVSSLTLAKTAFRNQVINGKPVSISPSLLLVGNVLEVTANNLWAVADMQTSTTANAPIFANNPHRGLYRPYVQGYLSNTGITDQDGAAISGQSDTQWYLFANPNSPQGSAIVIAFLDGRETPHFDEAETQFSIPGGIQFRSYLDWGVTLSIPQLALKSAGA